MAATLNKVLKASDQVPKLMDLAVYKMKKC